MQNDWRDLIKPKAVEFDEKELTPGYGRFFAEPLERGYGITIGNTLRRILLSSLPGFAVAAVRIKGVLHEFSTLPGVKEDVTDIVLNLKEVRLRLHEGDSVTATLKAKGEAVVSASDISGGPNLEILTPDQHLATLDKGADLDMELVIQRGRGYVPGERREEGGDEPIGTIRLDAIFSPIRKVNFTVTNARVGQRTDYDRLVLEIWTDGSISPREALTYAARVARDQMNIFAGLEEGAEAPEVPVGADSRPSLNESLFKPVAELPVSVRAFNGLQNADIKYVGELVQRSESDMLKIKNFGRKSLNEIKEVLTDMGLLLGMRFDSLPPRAELDRMWEEQERRESA